MPFVGSVEGKMAFGRATVSGGFVTTNMLLYLDAGNRASYPGTGTTWTDLSPNANNATSLTGFTYSSSNSGYLSFNGAGSGDLSANKYNTTYTGKTIFVAGNLTNIGAGAFRAFLGRNYILNTSASLNLSLHPFGWRLKFKLGGISKCHLCQV
jgi:hypothetical protein